MLVWSGWGLACAWGFFALLFGIFYIAPIAIIVLASLAGQWNGVLPSHLGFGNYEAVLNGDEASALQVSVVTGLISSVVALVVGTWAALSLRKLASAWHGLLQALFFLPSAVPSVSVGLGLLVAFSQPPVLLNGTVLIVLIAHLVLVSAYTFASVTAGLARLPPEVEPVASSLGGRPWYVLTRVTLPMLAPYLVAAFGLSFALSMGELGATVMVYPPSWVTMPVGIFALTDRGDVFQGAAQTMLLAGVTLALLLTLARVPTRAVAK
jgi:2-aminoethylphosphonate transport system permease protein